MTGRTISDKPTARESGAFSGLRSLAEAVVAWTAVLGDSVVSVDSKGLVEFKNSTIGQGQFVPVVLNPIDSKQVVDIVRIANRYRIPLYPISTGKNWGYGDACPSTDGCVVVNLSGMNRILDFENLSTYAVATIQPGVTQQILHDYLLDKSLPFMTPTHGGGPDCSILGNALERGYGITPIANHFDALTSMSAVLGNGNLHNSLFESMGARGISNRRKSQIGPDVDGLFAQSNFGIVTQAKVRLARRPKHVAVFLFQIPSNQRLAQLSGPLREILYEHYPKAVSAINLMNRLRVLAMVAPYPHENLNADRLISEPQLRALSKFYGIPEWIGAGTLFGSSRQSIQRAFNSIRQVLDGLVERPVWMDHRRIARASIASRMLPAHLGQPLRRRIQSIESFLNVASGHPSRVALPLAYWRAGMPTPSQPLNPASDGCGLIWYSPYVPIDRSCILMFQQMVDQTCRQYQIEPLITFTTVDEQTFDATVPILFDRASVEDAARAQCCYDALLRNGLELGVVPYRYPQSAMHRLYEISPNYWQSIQMLRDAWDPNRIIAPRRYCP